MKTFSQFMFESPNPSMQAKRMGLKADGHGGFGRIVGGTWEFVAKNIGGKLVFYNKDQRPGYQDRKQTETEKKLSYTTYAPINSSYDYGTVKYETELREKYINNQIFLEGDWVKSSITEQVGKIIRRGTNYLICVTENNEMFKSWIKDVYEQKIINEQKSNISNNDWAKQFINKYRKNKSY